MKRLCYLQSALQIFPSSLIHSQQSRPLNKQRKAERSLCCTLCTRGIVGGGGWGVIQTGRIWGFKVKIFFKYHGGSINMVRILKLGLERRSKEAGHGFRRRFGRPQLSSLNMSDTQVWANLKNVFYILKFSKRDTHSK